MRFLLFRYTLALKKFIWTVSLVGVTFTITYNISSGFRSQKILKYLPKFGRSDSLSNLTDFYFTENPQHICSMGFQNVVAVQNTIIIVVHSARENFLKRKIARRTFGIVKEYKGWFLQTVFTLGLPHPTENETIQIGLEKEIRENKDIVIGNFVDSYRNLTYKHLAGYKWVLENCPQVNFYVKADDDMTVDVFHVIGFLSSERSATIGKDIYCYINENQPVRNHENKWYLTREEYPLDTFPQFCSYGIYVAHVETVKKILAASSWNDFLWIDDVFVTGILRESANEEEIYPNKTINLIYSYAVNAAYYEKNKDSVWAAGFLGILQSNTHLNDSCPIWNSILEFNDVSNEYISTCESLFLLK